MLLTDEEDEALLARDDKVKMITILAREVKVMMIIILMVVMIMRPGRTR